MSHQVNGTVETRIAGVAYVESMRALVVEFVNGRMYAVSLADLEGLDATAATKVYLGSDGYAVVIEQNSGNRVDVPWDVILYHAEPEYAYFVHGTAAATTGADRHDIGDRIRHERSRRGWTLADLSAHTGIKVPNLSRLENGKHLPSLETLERVADAFGVPVAALVSERQMVGSSS